MPYTRKTQDEWTIEQHTEEGWEEVCAVSTWREARETLKEYRESQPEYPVRSRKHRVSLQPENFS